MRGTLEFFGDECSALAEFGTLRLFESLMEFGTLRLFDPWRILAHVSYRIFEYSIICICDYAINRIYDYSNMRLCEKVFIRIYDYSYI